MSDPLEAAYRTEKPRVLATLIRLLGSFDAAEEAVHEAFAAATVQWPRDGVPANPYAWLVSVGRFRAIDRQRRRGRLERALPELPERTPEPSEPAEIDDDELRLVFTCCHPALPPDARIALTLREVGGLTTEQIASAYLTRASTIAQRIVRAKAKIRDDAIPYEVPGRAELPERLESVLRVIYLIFSEGYAGRSDTLCAEAIRLGRRLARLVDDPEATGLVALMLLHASRRDARVDESGAIVLLEAQDRSRWDREAIREAQSSIARAVASRQAGPFLVQASIAGVHAEATTFDATDWPRIVALYDLLARVDPSPVVSLNRAVAVGMRDGAETGLVAIEAAMEDGRLDQHHLAHAARADFARRLGRADDARASYARALELAEDDAERRFLRERLRELG